MDDLRAFASERIRKSPVPLVHDYVVPAGGFIERFEVYPRSYDGTGTLLANTDVRMKYRMQVRLLDANGAEIPLDVEVIWREPATAEEMLKQ